MDVLKGRILERVTIKGTLTDTAQMAGGLKVPEVIYPPTYQGPVEVTPTEEVQTLETKDLMMTDDVTVEAIPSDYVGSEIERRDSTDLTASGPTVSAPSGYYEENASKTIPSGTAVPANAITAVGATLTASNNKLSLYRECINAPYVSQAGYIESGTQGTTKITLTADVNTRTSSDLTASGNTVTAPAGYYPSSASKSIPNAENVKGELILRGGALESWINEDSGVVAFAGTGTAGWIEADNSGYVSLNQYGEIPNAQVNYDISDAYQLSTQGATTITPSTSEQVAVAKGKFTTGAVKVAAMPTANFYTDFESGFITSNNVRKWRLRGVTVVDPEEEGNAGYIGEGTYEGGWDEFSAVPSGTTITPSTSSQTIGGANYMMEGPVTVSAMPSGTAGTPTATKGTVSNHSVSVTPSVTNTTGYITGSTKTGTAVTVSASELVSGSETKTANGTYDVTNLAELVVNVSGGGTSNFTLLGTKTVGTISTTSTTDTDTGQTIVIGSSAWNDYDLIVCECSVDTQTNGRHTCSTRLAWLTGTSTVTTKNTCTFATATWNSKKSSSGTATTRSSTTPYGVYAKAGTISGTNLTITIYQRYNSTQTGTINGSYTMRVYGCKIYDLIGG